MQRAPCRGYSPTARVFRYLCDLLPWQNLVVRNHSRSLNITTKVDSSSSTLGVILTNNRVDGVLPGGPAYLAGLRQGDRIVQVDASMQHALRHALGGCIMCWDVIAQNVLCSSGAVLISE